MNAHMSTKFLRPTINVVHQTGFVFIQEGIPAAEISLIILHFLYIWL